MHLSLLFFTSPLAAGTVARIAPNVQFNQQVPVSESTPQHGPGPFSADLESSASLFSHTSVSPSTAVGHTYFSLCTGYEGSVQIINNTPYRTYCYNSLWGSFVGLGYHDTIEGCESAYTSSAVKPKVGYHWYPSTGACYLFNNPTDQLYVYHYGNYEKVFFAPLDIATPPEESPLCPPPKEGGWTDIAGHTYRLYCRGMAKADPKDVKSYEKATLNVTECATWARGVGGKMWHWWQPYQDAAPGLATGQRNCEAIMKMPDRLVPLRTKDTYVAGVPYFSGEDAGDMYEGIDMK